MFKNIKNIFWAIASILIVSCSSETTEIDSEFSFEEKLNNYVCDQFNLDTIYDTPEFIEAISDDRFKYYLIKLNPNAALFEVEEEPLRILFDKEMNLFIHDKIYTRSEFVNDQNVIGSNHFVPNVYSQAEYRTLKYQMLQMNIDSLDEKVNFLKTFFINQNKPDKRQYNDSLLAINTPKELDFDSCLTFVREKLSSSDGYSLEILRWLEAVNKMGGNALCLQYFNKSIRIFDFTEFLQFKSSAIITEYYFHVE